jgi:hypothetical protein
MEPVVMYSGNLRGQQVEYLGREERELQSVERGGEGGRDRDRQRQTERQKIV